MTGIADDVDALSGFALIDQLQYRRMQMHMVADHFAAHLRIGQGRDAAKQFFITHPEEAEKLEAEVRRNFDKLMSNQSRIAAQRAGRAVDVSADDFDDAN